MVVFDHPVLEKRPAQWSVLGALNEEVLTLHERVDAEAREIGLDLPWYVRLRPALSGEDEDVAEAEEE